MYKLIRYDISKISEDFDNLRFNEYFDTILVKIFQEFYDVFLSGNKFSIYMSSDVYYRYNYLFKMIFNLEEKTIVAFYINNNNIFITFTELLDMDEVLIGNTCFEFFNKHEINRLRCKKLKKLSNV